MQWCTECVGVGQARDADEILISGRFIEGNGLARRVGRRMMFAPERRLRQNIRLRLCHWPTQKTEAYRTPTGELEPALCCHYNMGSTVIWQHFVTIAIAQVRDI